MLNISNNREEKEPSKPLITPRAIVTEEAEKNISVFAVVCVIIVVVMTVLFYGFKVYQSSQLKHQQAVYSDLLAKLNVKDIADIDKTAQSLQKGIAAYQSYIGGQADYSKLFQELQKDVPKTVKLNNFSVSDKGEIKLDGEGSDYISVAKTIAIFSKSEMFSNVTLTSSTSSTGQDTKVTFSLTMKLNINKLK